MGPIEKIIHSKITNSFEVTHLVLENESHKHSSPLGSESHFKVILVSDTFDGMKRIDRSRALHDLLTNEIKNIHALSLKLFSNSEWDKLNNMDTLKSPDCSGGNK